jgi:aminopeptidase N
MNLAAFKAFVTELISNIIAKCDAQARKDAEAIATISAKAEELSKALEAANAAVEEAKAAALAAATAQAAELDALTTELQNTFNPTPVADALAVAVEASPEVETPVSLFDAVTIDTADSTPVEVVEASLDAIEAAAEPA